MHTLLNIILLYISIFLPQISIAEVIYHGDKTNIADKLIAIWKKNIPYLAEYKVKSTEGEFDVVIGVADNGIFYIKYRNDGGDVLEQWSPDGKIFYMRSRNQIFSNHDFLPLAQAIMALDKLTGKEKLEKICANLYLDKNSLRCSYALQKFAYEKTILQDETLLSKNQDGNYKIVCDQYGILVIDATTADIVEQKFRGRSITRKRIQKEKVTEKIKQILDKINTNESKRISLDQILSSGTDPVRASMQSLIDDVENETTSVDHIRDILKKNQKNLRSIILPGIFYGQRRNQNAKILDELNSELLNILEKHVFSLKLSQQATKKYLTTNSVKQHLEPLYKEIIMKKLDASSNHGKDMIMKLLILGELTVRSEVGTRAYNEIQTALIATYLDYLTDISVRGVLDNFPQK